MCIGKCLVLNDKVVLDTDKAFLNYREICEQ